jgi:hypothetical protein
VIKEFFKKWKQVVGPKKITANQIWNMDETHILTENYNNSRVLARKGSKSAPIRKDNKGKHVTALAAISAAGNYLPPVFIFEEKPPENVLEDALPNTLVGRTDKGWINQEMFEKYFEHIIPLLPTKRPLIFLLDGHNSHFTFKTLSLAAENDIKIFCFPSHLTHLLQPLDVGVFGPFKQKYNSLFEEWKSKNIDQ